MPNCPTCSQPVGSDIPATLNAFFDWDSAYWNGVGYGEFIFHLDDLVEVTAVQEGSVDSYGFVEDAEIFVVVKVGGRHFKKEGVIDSYSGREWRGPVREVFPKTRTITEYAEDN